MSKYKVVTSDSSTNQELVFESDSLAQCRTVESMLLSRYRYTNVKVELITSYVTIKNIKELYHDNQYLTYLFASFKLSQKIDNIIYPCLFENSDSVLLLQFTFNSSVNNFSAHDENGEWVYLKKYPNQGEVLAAIERGFNALLNNQ